MREYYQFCPIALASEVVGERWTPLILRELFAGNRKFGHIRRGIPLISRSMLAKRLKHLRRAGIVDKDETDPAHPEWVLTEAGRELHPVIEALGTWGQRWVQAVLRDDQLDAGYLMWNVWRRIDLDRVPDERLLVLFRFTDGPKAKRKFWLIIDGDDTELCLTWPGFEVDLTVESSVRALVEVWRGFVPAQEAIEAGRIRLDGPSALCREFPSWLLLSHFAHVERPPVQ